MQVVQAEPMPVVGGVPVVHPMPVVGGLPVGGASVPVVVGSAVFVPQPGSAEEDTLQRLRGMLAGGTWTANSITMDPCGFVKVSMQTIYDPCLDGQKLTWQTKVPIRICGCCGQTLSTTGWISEDRTIGETKFRTDRTDIQDMSGNNMNGKIFKVALQSVDTVNDRVVYSFNSSDGESGTLVYDLKKRSYEHVSTPPGRQEMRLVFTQRN
jgi:hypothetical protein